MQLENEMFNTSYTDSGFVHQQPEMMSEVLCTIATIQGQQPPCHRWIFREF